MQVNEIWLPVPKWEDLYEVSNLGNVRSIRKNKLLKPSLTYRGYLLVGLSKKHTRETWLIHRLVATAFIPNPNNLEQVNHVDGNKLNNILGNLEWCTRLQNVAHARQIGLVNSDKGNKPIPIIQYDKEMVQIQTFESGIEAAKTTGFFQSGINHCLKGRLKTYKGYVWRYEITPNNGVNNQN